MSSQFKDNLRKLSIRLAMLTTYQDVLNFITEVGYRISLFEVEEDVSFVSIQYPTEVSILKRFSESHKVRIYTNDAELTGHMRMQVRLLATVEHIRGIHLKLKSIELNDLVDV